MANVDNLNRIRSESEAREKGAKGGRASGKSRREKKLLRERLEALLEAKHDGMETAEAITLALIEKALSGDVRAYEVIRDTLGQKPVEKAENKVKGKLEIKWLQ